MHRCEDCKLILDDDAQYCPKCGNDISESKYAGDPPSVEVGALLTSANLHRIRQEWDKAIADATEALRQDPTNSNIASLLANIYEQRGMLDDAAIWYEMSLEMNPSSTEDKLRLEQVKAQISLKQKKSVDTFDILQRRTKLWAGLLGGLCLLIVVFALVITAIRPHVQKADPTPMATAPTATGPRSSQAKAGSPNMIPGASGPTESTDSQQSSETTDLAGAPAGQGTLRTSAELKINKELTASQKIQEAGVKIDDVIADPRQNAAIVTYSVPSNGNSSKDSVIKAAAAVAQATFAAHKQVNTVTVRCLITMGNSSSTQVVFVGDTARNAMASIGANTTSVQLLNTFTNQWWNPQIK